MSLFSRIKKYLRHGRVRSPMGVSHSEFVFPESWAERTRLAIASADNARIPRVADAGAITGDVQIMHNGLRVRTDSYYGPEYTALFTANRGVHEPQEERVFNEMLPSLRPGSLMLELGAFWGFYSAWFLTSVKDSHAILVEPMQANLDSGRGNLTLNGVADRAEFIKGWVGTLAKHYQEPGGEQIALDTFLDRRRIERLDVLHADVQGAECDMLRGGKRSIASGRVGWVFLSTHSMYKHADCKRYLLKLGMRLVAEADLPESFSYDGLLVFKRPGEPGPDHVEISQRDYHADRAAAART